MPTDVAQTIDNSYAKRFRRWFMPSYDEATIFLMAITCIALFVTDPNLREQIRSILLETFERNTWLYVLPWFAVIVGGIGISISSVFFARPLNYNKKCWMIAYSMTVNGIAGIVCGLQLMDDFHGWQAVFPIWNIICGLAIIYGMAWADDHVMLDGRASITEIGVGIIILAAVFGYCHFISRLTWAMTFSICVSYASSFDHIFRRLFRTISVPTSSAS